MVKEYQSLCMRFHCKIKCGRIVGMSPAASFFPFFRSILGIVDQQIRPPHERCHPLIGLRRSLFAQMIPNGREAEFYSFY